MIIRFYTKKLIVPINFIKKNLKTSNRKKQRRLKKMNKCTLEGTEEEMEKPKTNLFFKPIECWNGNKFKHRTVLTKYHGVFSISTGS